MLISVWVHVGSLWFSVFELLTFLPDDGYVSSDFFGWSFFISWVGYQIFKNISELMFLHAAGRMFSIAVSFAKYGLLRPILGLDNRISVLVDLLQIRVRLMQPTIERISLNSYVRYTTVPCSR